MAYRVGILTISDRCASGASDDTSGATLCGLVVADGLNVALKAVVPDDFAQIQETLRDWSDNDVVDIIITTGGTGFTKRDVTPEATQAVLDKSAPGIAVAITSESLKVTPLAMLSRLVAGSRKATLIVNFPGSPKACKECYAVVAPILTHCVDQLKQRTEHVLAKHVDMQKSAASLSSTDSSTSKVKPIPAAYRARVSPYAMLSVDEALACILNETTSIKQTEHVSIKHTHRLSGRILAHDVRAQVPLPPFPASIKDGYAVIAQDGAGTRQVSPMSSTAGISPQQIGIISGFCVRINTGAPLPRGADAVVQVEDTELLEYSAEGEEIQVDIKVVPVVGQDIRNVGSDIAEGELVLKKGVRLGAIELGLIAAVGLDQVEVVREPAVGLLSTGDELLESGQPYKDGFIWDSNKTTLQALFHDQKIKATDLGIARDEADAVYHILAKAFDDVDVVVSTGGVSMGERDVLKRVLLEDFDAQIHFGRVNMKPGKPATYATLIWKGARKSVFALPGNPVSAYVTCFLFVIPALRLLSGRWLDDRIHTPTLKCHRTVKAKLSIEKVIVLDERPEYVRAIVSYTEDGIRAELIRGSQRSSRLLSVKEANALAILPSKSHSLSELHTDVEIVAILL